MPDNITPSPYSSYAGASTIFSVTGTATAISTDYLSAEVSVKEGISPILAFKYIKKKFGILERIVLDRRLQKLEKAFNTAVQNGQEALGQKILREVAIQSKESVMYALGIRHFVEREAITKVKYKIKNGHISDTRLEDYTKVIPSDVIRKKDAVQGAFDGFVIYHYYNQKNEDAIAKKQKMDPAEKAKMRDPILFGWIKEHDRLYFVADWEDEYCDLTFDELIGVVASDKLTKYPTIKP